MLHLFYLNNQTQIANYIDPNEGICARTKTYSKRMSEVEMKSDGLTDFVIDEFVKISGSSKMTIDAKIEAARCLAEATIHNISYRDLSDEVLDRYSEAWHCSLGIWDRLNVEAKRAIPIVRR